MAAGAQRRNNVAPHTVAPKETKEVIAVGCKLPHGIHMDMHRKGQPIERVTLKGTNSLQQGALIKVSMIGGFAVTENVPKAFFEAWMKDHEEHPAVKNGLIFHHKQLASVVDMGKERENDVFSGLDPIDPKNTGVKGIQTATDKDPE